MLRFSIKNLHSAFLAKVISPVDLCRVCLKRIERLKPLNAYITVASEAELLREAEKSAERYAKGAPLSAIDGMPFSVKDNLCTKDIRTTCASRTLEAFIPPYTATVVERCTSNGALLIGKTNLDEFGMGSSSLESRFGAVYNPFNLFLRGRPRDAGQQSVTARTSAWFDDLQKWLTTELHGDSVRPSEVKVDEQKAYIAGGSSGGSAVSVATNTCVFALATDTGGSARNPAAHCGVAALKPTYGTVSRHGLVALMTAFDTPSVIASCADDLRVVYDLVSGFDGHDATTYPVSAARSGSSEVRVGVPEEFAVPGLSEDVRAAWQSAVDCLQSEAAVERCNVPHLRLAANCYLVIMCCEVASNFARYDGVRYGLRTSGSCDSFEEQLMATRASAFGDTVKGRIVAGNYFLLRENATRFYEQARKVNRLIVNDVERALERCDVLLTPTTAYPAPLVADYRRSACGSSGTDQTVKILSEDVCTVVANLCGLPAVSVPVAMSTDSHCLPIAVQLIGRRGSEHTVLRLASLLEQRFRFDQLVEETRAL